MNSLIYYYVRQAISLFFVTLVLTTPSPAHATDSFVAGVQVRASTVTEPDLARISQIGFNGIRFGLRKEAVISSNGKENWARYDKLMDWARLHKLTTVITLFDGHPKTADGSPQTGWFQDFSAFAAQAVERYAGSNRIVWEIWNEPNGTRYWPSTPNATIYAQLVRDTCRQMRARDRNAIILAGALGTGAGEIPYEPFINQLAPLVRTGCISGISLHPYRQIAPESVTSTLSGLRARYPGIRFDITEWGYTMRGKAYSRRTAEIWAGRLLIASRMAGANIGILYEWRSGSEAVNGQGQNFGLIQPNGSDSGALPLVARSLRWLRDDVSACSFKTDNLYCLQKVDSSGKSTMLLWSDRCEPIHVSGKASFSTSRWDKSGTEPQRSTIVTAGPIPIEVSGATAAELSPLAPSSSLIATKANPLICP